MQLRQLEYFVAVAESMNITHAAGQLFITQQALSEQINKLETEYGVKFFIRGKKLALTKEGEFMLMTARQILGQERTLRNALSTLSENINGTINVGMSFVRSRLLFPSLLAAFKQHFPMVTIQLFMGNSEKIKADILSGTTDIVIGFDQFFSEDINTFPLFNERLFVTIPRRFLVEKYGDSWSEMIPVLAQGVDLSDFASVPIIMINRSNYIWHLTQRVFAEKRIEPNIIFEGNDMDLLCNISKAGLGMAFASELMASSEYLFREDGDDTLHVFPLAGPIYLPLVIGYNKKQYFSQLSRAFVEIVREEYVKKVSKLQS